METTIEGSGASAAVTKGYTVSSAHSLVSEAMLLHYRLGQLSGPVLSLPLKCGVDAETIQIHFWQQCGQCEN